MTEKIMPFVGNISINSLDVTGSSSFSNNQNISLNGNVRAVWLDGIFVCVRIRDTTGTESSPVWISSRHIMTLSNAEVDQSNRVTVGGNKVVQLNFGDGYTPLHGVKLIYDGTGTIPLQLQWNWRWPFGYGNLEPNPPDFAFYQPGDARMDFAINLYGRYSVVQHGRIQ